jgi:hypothetical protein
MNSWNTLSPKDERPAEQDNHPMRNHSSALTTISALTLGLSACSPAQNWRDVSFEGSALKVQLPCKPDRTTRAVPLAGGSVDLQVVGCKSESSMVAVMTATLPTGADANEAMVVWQKAALDNARVERPLAPEQQQTWHRSTHLPLTTSIRVQVMGLLVNGEPVAMDAVWGALAEGDRLRLIHAVVYDKNKPTELANTLFESFKP